MARASVIAAGRRLGAHHPWAAAPCGAGPSDASFHDALSARGAPHAEPRVRPLDAKPHRVQASTGHPGIARRPRPPYPGPGSGVLVSGDPVPAPAAPPEAPNPAAPPDPLPPGPSGDPAP